MSIEVRRIRKSFGQAAVLNDISLTVADGELVALLGPSGSGKTTLLRIIAGLDTADSGTVLIDGQDMSKEGARERRVGFVFQHYALFKHMTVFENVAFGLRVRHKAVRPTEEEIREKVMSLLKLVHLDAFYSRLPSQLSGGQRQRVALARALAVEPKLLLLDEPFGALDAKVRKELRRWMRRLHDDIHITSVFVTHDQEEAMEVSDRVVVLGQGKIEQVGTPEEVWQFPANAFVYDFLGNYNAFDGFRDANGQVHLTLQEEPLPQVAAGAIAQQPAGLLGRYPNIRQFLGKLIPDLISDTQTVKLPPPPSHRPQPENGTPVTLFARPHEIYVVKKPEHHEYIRARILHINPAGALVKIELERAGGEMLQAEIPKTAFTEMQLKKFDEVFVRPKEMKVFE